ncbi:Winged helix-turn-helix transcription repressor DNA-binding protein [Beauveria brongniartii RCEF 3172]|uniref:Methylated-DNA--protein-cysteine methyltransferase n=1 Tax=Beauveria brongniartii RCEF 3172 TaxID=1081107 RepID=A0A167HLS1_9HYPO|nr:Winged helix-turn-helix transcription repressor DNA-binding protein [Beauveria brongniartii RCEF 3172]
MATRITMYTPANPSGTTTTTTTTTSSYSPLAFTAKEAAILTPFQKRVFHLLKQIPAGRVTTYGSIARALRTSPRAVGNALRNNVFAPRIPCHRCVASTGYVNGYDGEVIEKATFARQRGQGGRDEEHITGKASQSRAGRVKAGRNKERAQPPSGTNIQRKLDLLKTEGVSFDDKGMLMNKYKVLFDGPWHVLVD